MHKLCLGLRHDVDTAAGLGECSPRKQRRTRLAFFCETAWNLQTGVAPVSALCVLVPKKEVDDQRRSGPRVRSAWGERVSRMVVSRPRSFQGVLHEVDPHGLQGVRFMLWVEKSRVACPRSCFGNIVFVKSAPKKLERC